MLRLRLSKAVKQLSQPQAFQAGFFSAGGREAGVHKAPLIGALIILLHAAINILHLIYFSFRRGEADLSKGGNKLKLSRKIFGQTREQCFRSAVREMLSGMSTI